MQRVPCRNAYDRTRATGGEAVVVGPARARWRACCAIPRRASLPMNLAKVGVPFFTHACRLGAEGVVSSKRSEPRPATDRGPSVKTYYAFGRLRDPTHSAAACPVTSWYSKCRKGAPPCLPCGGRC